jgi:peptidylprolyl isomerase
VIRGWEQGLEGIEGGDRRELVLPPDLTEGSYPPGIPKGRAVIFVVEAIPSSSPKGGKSSKPKPKPKPESKPTTNKTKPKVEVPKGPPPKKLVIKDLEKGKGPEAKIGDEVTVEYVGVDYKTGKQFDASWDRGEPFTFELGVGQVIAGWEQGIEGMKVGGRRELIIPPDLAYGSEGGGSIAPNSTLIFVVDLLAIE